jgi:predicted DNA-binding transcriptional regulator AlpA
MTAASPADGYWCENVVRSPDAGAQWRLGCCRAQTPSHAMDWLRHQAARIAGVDRTTLYRLWSEGRGPDSFKIGHRRMITVAAAAQWQESLERSGRKEHRAGGSS